MSSGSCWGVQRPSRRPGGPAAGADRERFVPRSFVGDGDWTLAAPLLADLLLLTAAEHHGTAADLEECLTAAEALPLPGMADWLAVYRRQGCPPVHHSPAYREAYDPHYRVLRTAYGGYFPALLAAARLARSGRPAVVAIDGRCGSGKSGLGDLMGRLLPATWSTWTTIISHRTAGQRTGSRSRLEIWTWPASCRRYWCGRGRSADPLPPV